MLVRKLQQTDEHLIYLSKEKRTTHLFGDNHYNIIYINTWMKSAKREGTRMVAIEREKTLLNGNVVYTDCTDFGSLKTL